MGLARRKAFYAPTAKQFRISSNSSIRARPVPVTGRVAPHRGVDFCDAAGYAGAVGGDGEVVVAKTQRRRRHYIAIRHGRTYTTRCYALACFAGETGAKSETRGDRGCAFW